VTADRIELRGLRVLARCGVLAEELDRPQPLEIDVVLEVDLGDAARSDDLADTVDYGAVLDRVVALATSSHHALLERLAAAIADCVLEDERVDAVVVAVRKLRPPVPHDLASTGVSIRRGKQ
jgi:dihydroneopterin aldolase